MTSQNYDNFMAALCIFREARGCPMTQMNCILWVIRNRASDPKNRWPKYLADVVIEPAQFSSFNNDDPNSNAFPNRQHQIDWNAFLSVLQVVSNPLGPDLTLGANHYYSGNSVPYWAVGKEPTLTLGNFKFFKL